MSSSVLNLVIYFPLVAALILAFLPREQHGWIKKFAFGAAAFNFLFSLVLLGDFHADDNARYQFLTDIPWIQQFGIQYKVGLDGISLSLVLLTTLLSAIAILASWEAIHERVKEYYIFLLLLETGMLGVFSALDLVVFYAFWEAMLIPMYFLIGIWGGPRRGYATIKFVLYTLVGSLLMFVAIIWLYWASGANGQPGTFDITQLTSTEGPLAGSTALPPNARMWLFLAFAAAFAIKVPMFPFHTWLPDAHVEAPTAGSVILAGVLLKMGTYGFLRFCIPLFPDVAIKLAPWFLVLSVIGIIYGALMAYVQQDIKRLVAYSSVSHLGFCVLGLFAFTREGVAGSVLQMINHGLSTGALFLLVGMIYERRHTRDIKDFGGLWKVVPVFATLFLITTLSSVGLPGLNGFVGEFMILLGTWGPLGIAHPARFALNINQWSSVLASTGVILSAIYMLWMFQRVMQGPLDNRENQKLKDLSFRERVLLAPLILLMFYFGIQPRVPLSYIDQAIFKNVVNPIEQASAAPIAAPSAPSLPPGLSLPNGMKLPGMPGGGLGSPHGSLNTRPGGNPGMRVRPGRPGARPRPGAGAPKSGTTAAPAAGTGAH